MTGKDRETIRELVRLEHLLMGLPGDPRPRLTVAGEDRGAGPWIRLAEVIPFRACGAQGPALGARFLRRRTSGHWPAQGLSIPPQKAIEPPHHP
jgi:hypothetical protein